MITRISLQDLRALRERRSPHALVEALPEASYRAGHLPGALHLPLEGLAARAAVLLPDRRLPVVVYCSGSTCQNSELAARKLDELGYADVHVFTEGKAAWREAGLPLEQGPGQAAAESEVA